MDESTFETFEEELGTPPPKPVRQARRPETYAHRRLREEPPSIQHVPKTVPREPAVSKDIPLRRAMSLQNLSQIEVPWEGVTINRCLFVALTILAITSGLQRVKEALHGQTSLGDEETLEEGLSLRHTTLRKRSPSPEAEPESSLWDTLFWWFADDDNGRGAGRLRKTAGERSPRSLRHKKLPERKLLKQSDGRLKGRRGKRKEAEYSAEDKVKEKRKSKKKAKEMKLNEETDKRDEEEEGEEHEKEEDGLEEKTQKKEIQTPAKTP